LCSLNLSKVPGRLLDGFGVLTYASGNDSDQRSSGGILDFFEVAPLGKVGPVRPRADNDSVDLMPPIADGMTSQTSVVEGTEH